MDKLLTSEEYKWVTTWSEFKKEGNGQGSGHSHNNENDPVEMLKIPNGWVVDAVQICPQQDYKWSVVGPELDRGYKRSEEHTSELQSRQYLVCRLLLEK